MINLSEEKILATFESRKGLLINLIQRPVRPGYTPFVLRAKYWSDNPKEVQLDEEEARVLVSALRTHPNACAPHEGIQYRHTLTEEDRKYPNIPVRDHIIVDHLATLSVTESGRNKGWRKELNLMAWNGYPVKYDIREWAPKYDRMARGITLVDKEAAKLAAVLETALN